jgi:hypothetical protein
MEADTTHRLSALNAEIHRLESSLAQSPEDAFGYLELGCLFAEADQRESAIDAFRQSYAHRTGGLDVAPESLPIVDEQLQEAFDVALGQAPVRARGRTRELFEIAVRQEKRAEVSPLGRRIGGIALLAVIALAAFGGILPVKAASGYWPAPVSLHAPSDLPSASGYWPLPNGGM